MTDEANTEETGNSIADDLKAALAQHEEPEPSDAVDSDEATQEASGAEEEASEETPDTETDNSGDEEPAEKAASSDDATESADSEEDGEDESDQDEDGKKTPEEEAGPPVELPPTLSDTHKETLRALPRDAQEFLVARHKDMEADYTRKTQETAELRKTAEAFNAAAEPFRPYIASLGTTPVEAFNTLMAAEYRLRNGTPEQKSVVLAQLAKDYGISLPDLADQTEDDPVDPHVARVEQRIAGMERNLAQQHQAAATQVNQDAEAQIKTFADAQDDQGNALYPHFDAVRSSMGAFIGADPTMDMGTAYQTAVLANPELRQQQLAKDREALEADIKAKQGADRKKADLAKAEKVKKAKKAAKSVTTQSAPVGKPASTENSLRDELAAQFEQASSP